MFAESMDTSSVDEIQEFMEDSIKGLYTINGCIVVLWGIYMYVYMYMHVTMHLYSPYKKYIDL
jgi:hypothetical protein